MGELRVVIDSTFDAVPAVGDAVRALCRNEGMSETDATMVELGVVESVNNTIEHAYQGHAGGRIEVHLVVDAAHVDAEITDDGAAADPATFTPRAPQLDPADRMSLPEGGFGLVILNGIFDEVTFTREGAQNRLRLKKAREARHA